MKKAPNLLQLTLGFVFIIFKPFRCIIGFVTFDSKYVISEMNPWTIGEEELVAHLVDKGIICSTIQLFIFIVRTRG